jgi:hypothetical protein
MIQDAWSHEIKKKRLSDNRDQTTYVALISRYFSILKGSDFNRKTKSFSGDPSVNSDVNSSWSYYIYTHNKPGVG